MEKPLFVFAKFHSKNDKVNEMKEILHSFIKETLNNESGCISYNYLQSIDDETLFTSSEVWKDVQSEIMHWEMPHTKDLLEALPEVLSGSPEVTKFNRI